MFNDVDLRIHTIHRYFF